MNDSRLKLFREGYRKDLVQQIAKNINNEESFTLLGMPGVGISSMLKYIEDPDFLTRYKIKKDTLIINIDLNNLLETNLASLYRLIFKRLIESIKDSPQVPIDIKKDLVGKYKEVVPNADTFILFEETKDTIKMLASKSIKVVFILDEFIKLKEIGKLAFSNLKAIRDIAKDYIVFIFIGNQDLSKLMDQELLEGLYTLFRYKFIYVAPPTKNDADYVFDEHEERFEIKLGVDIRNKVYEITGGNLWFMKKVNGIYSEEPEIINGTNDEVVSKLLSRYDMEITLDYFWDKLSKKDQDDLINESYKTDDTDNQNSYLIRAGIIKYTEDGYHYFSSLVEAFITVNKLEGTKEETISKEGEFKINKEDRIIVKQGKVIGSELTKTEFDVLVHIIENSGKAVTRDEIGVVMWGDERFEKYSDYAIDRIISRIRSKIGENASAPKYLKTVKGVGFRFINS